MRRAADGSVPASGGRSRSRPGRHAPGSRGVPTACGARPGPGRRQRAVDRLAGRRPADLGRGAACSPACGGSAPLTQPPGQGRCVAAGQQVEGLAGLAVDEHGAIALSASGGEVVDAQHLRNGPVGIGQGHDHPQKRCPPHPRVQDSGQTTAGPAAECDGDSLQNPPGGRCPAAISNGLALDLLGESAPRTTNVLAVQPPHRQLDHYRPIPDRRIGKASSVRAVHPVGHNRTPWAGHLGFPGSRHHVNRSALEEHALHQQLAEVRKQVTDELITPDHDPR